MRDTIKFRFTGTLTMLVTCAIFAVAAMLLWNALLPELFALPQITYLQAVGLLILARLLFGGIGGWHGREPGRGKHMFHHGNRFRERWMNMSDEERKEFFDFNRRFSHSRDPFRNDEDGREKRDEGNE